MDLQQEYYTRNKLTAPLIRFADKNVLLLRQNDEKSGIPSLIGVTITFAGKSENNPGSFKFVQQILSYDSGTMSNNIWKNLWEKRLEFDDWEAWIQDWAKVNQGLVTAIPENEVELALWEIFIYSHDTFLASQVPNSVQDKLCNILDPELSIPVRLTSAGEVETFIKNKNKNVIAHLVNLRSLYSNGNGTYAGWLVQLLRQS